MKKRKVIKNLCVVFAMLIFVSVLSAIVIHNSSHPESIYLCMDGNGAPIAPDSNSNFVAEKLFRDKDKRQLISALRTSVMRQAYAEDLIRIRYDKTLIGYELSELKIVRRYDYVNHNSNEEFIRLSYDIAEKCDLVRNDKSKPEKALYAELEKIAYDSWEDGVVTGLKLEFVANFNTDLSEDYGYTIFDLRKIEIEK